MDTVSIARIERLIELNLSAPQESWLYRNDETEWPDDGPSKVFLARAINQIGATMLGSDWTGKEGAEALLPFLEGASDLKGVGFAVDYGKMLLMAFGHRQSDNRGPLTFAEATTAVTLFQNRLAEGRIASHARLDTVLSKIRAVLAAGQLQSFTRGFHDGEFRVVPVDLWNMDDIRVRLIMCLMDPEQPAVPCLLAPSLSKDRSADPAVNPVQPSYIFVSRETLDAVIASLADLTDSKPSDAVAVSDVEPKHSEAVVRRWFEARISAWVQGGSNASDRPTLKELMEEGAAEFPGLAGQRIRDLWDDLAPHEWKAKGPRPRGKGVVRE